MALDIPDLDNGKLDLNFIAAIATSQAATATDRFGHTKPTLSGAMANLIASMAAVMAQVGPAQAAIGANVSATNAVAAAAQADIESRRDVGALAIAQAVANLTTENLNGLAGSTGATMIGSGTRSVQNRLDDQASILDKGAVLNGVTNDAAALVAINASAAGRPILISGIAHIGSPVTITAPLVDVDRQIFTLNSQVTIDNGQAVRPEWFGNVQGALAAAVNALPATGGTVRLRARRYKPSGFAYGFDGAGKYIGKPNVSILGERMPGYSANCDRLEGGTVIEGPLIFFAPNIEFRDLGVDSGIYVLNTYYGGVVSPGIAGEGLLGTYPNNALKNAAALMRGARLHNIRCLAPNPTAQVHALILAEGYADVQVTGVTETCFATHGIAIKAANVRCEILTSYASAGEGVIAKTDAQATAIAADIVIGKVITNLGGPPNTAAHTAAPANSGVGLMLNPQGGYVAKILIGSVVDRGHAIGFGLSFGGPYAIDNIQVDQITTDENAVAGVNLFSETGGIALVNTQFGQIITRNTPIGLKTNLGAVQVGKLLGANVGVLLEATGTAQPIIGMMHGDGVTDALMRISGGARPKILAYSKFGAGTMFSTAGDVPALVNGWTAIDVFVVRLCGNTVFMSGKLTPGSSFILAQLPPWARPNIRRDLLVQGRNGAGQNAVPLTIGADGVVLVNEIAGGTANCSTWLSVACSYTLDE